MRQRCPDCDNIYNRISSFENANGRCHHCHGQGRGPSMAFGIEQECSECHGTGICQTCHGAGEADIHSTWDEPLFDLSTSSPSVTGVSPPPMPTAASPQPSTYGTGYSDSPSPSVSFSVSASPSSSPRWIIPANATSQPQKLEIDPAEQAIKFAIIGAAVGIFGGWLISGVGVIVISIASMIANGPYRGDLSSQTATQLFFILWALSPFICGGIGYLSGRGAQKQ